MKFKNSGHCWIENLDGKYSGQKREQSNLLTYHLTPHALICKYETCAYFNNYTYYKKI